MMSRSLLLLDTVSSNGRSVLPTLAKLSALTLLTLFLVQQVSLRLLYFRTLFLFLLLTMFVTSAAPCLVSPGMSIFSWILS